MGVLLGALVTGATALAPPAAATTSSLCGSYSAGTCGITSEPVLSTGQLLQVSVEGNPGVPVALRFYVVEFDSEGRITDLVPASPTVSATTYESRPGVGRITGALLAPDPPLTQEAGGWGFVGLADDTTLDLTRRVGRLIEYGGRTVRLLGDGYADQKPLSGELDMHLVGNIPATGYWVEYLDGGDWIPVPGHGFDQATRLGDSPGETSVLRYTIPETLAVDEPYTFRVNHHLNYGGSLEHPAIRQAFADWTVIRSGDPVEQRPDRNLDPTEHRFDPELVPGPTPAPTPSSSPPSSTEPVPSPTGKPTPKPTGKPSEKPDDHPAGQPSATGPSGAEPSDAGPTNSARPSPGPGVATEAPGTDRPSSIQAGPPVSAAPPSTPPSSTPAATAHPSADPTMPTGAVWGEEALGSRDLSASSTPIASSASSLLGALALGALAAPLGWWLLARRRSTQGLREPLT